MDEDGNLNGDNCAKDPYFLKKVYTVPARLLIDQGYLSTPVIGEIGTEQYDTSGLVMNNSGKWQSASVDQAFVGHGRKTAAVVADVVRQSAGRKGVMLFAATVQHAEEIMASLPPGLSRMIGGKINTGKAERKRLVADFKAQRFKYLVSVQTMTTGVDFTHVDVVAILRATESVALLQQIIGRGLRVHEGKRDVLILDYAENLERHCPDGDIFSPEISANMTNGEKVIIDAECESCGAINKFSARKNPEGLQLDKHGYFMDLAGNRVETDHGPMPGHYGRRCKGMIKRGGTHTQCSQRWTFKAMKRDPTQIQTDKVLSMDKKPVVTRTGKECVLVTFETEWRSFSVWLHPEAPRGRLHAEYLQFMDATQSGVEIPETVTYQKDSTSGFYRIYDYGRAADAIS
jgi:DNA repair protein RadD